MGLPGSGKSTYAKDYLADHIENTVWCSSDVMRKQLYGDENIQGNANTVFHHLHNKVARHLREGDNVIYDATNVNRKSRRGIIQIAKAIGADIHGVIIWSTIDECITRDAARERTVGPQVIDKFIKRWESPFYDEGFDSLEIVYNSEVKPFEYMQKLFSDMDIPHDNPHHTLDIVHHCMLAEELMSNEVPGDGRLQFIMRYHDCGKPYTKFFKDEDLTHAHYYSHNNVGGYLIYGAYAGLEDTLNYDIMFVSWAITNHMEPFFNSKYYQNMDPKLKYFIDVIHKCDRGAH